jgi:hypothetical protein
MQSDFQGHVYFSMIICKWNRTSLFELFLQFISKNYFWLFIVEQLYQFLQVDARKGESLLLNHRFLALIFAVVATDFRIGLVALLFADDFYIECLFSVESGMIMNTEFRIWGLSPL